MKIAIMSDSHDRWDKLEIAIGIANDRGCKYLLFAGDFISPPGVEILEKFSGQVIVVWGNNEGERSGLTRAFDRSDKIELAGDIYIGEMDGVRIFMNHYPEVSELAGKSKDFDLVIHGHTHDYREEKLANTLLVNPGEIQGYKTGKSSFMIYDTTTREIERIDLE